MSWNLNSLAKDNFDRIRLIEAHNTLFKYDLISICETSLNDSVEVPETLINDYTFVPANNPANIRHGGVGLFFKNSLPVIVRNDLSFDESVVIELKFARKKIFFTTLYRSPAFNHTSSKFQVFLSNFKSLHSKIQGENPFATFFIGDFNAHSQFGGLMVIQLLRVLKLKISLLHWDYLKLFRNQQLLNLIRIPHVLISSQLTNQILF